MQKMEYQVKFVTPAFLGNAEQSGQWRTPPFKALLRQWWRVAVAKDVDYDHRELRKREGRLFGHTWLESDKDDNGKQVSRASSVRLRVEPWASGRLNKDRYPSNEFTRVRTTQDGRGKVRSDLYLGFGPILPPSKKERRDAISLKQAAIAPDEGAKLTLQSQLQLPGNKWKDVEDAVQLAHWFGALGSRSRNGWGSLAVSAKSPPKIQRPQEMFQTDLFKKVTRPLSSCLTREWPHALGCDKEGPLIWVSTPVDNWQKAINFLANVLVRVRRTAKDYQPGGRNISGIHLLGYPAGSGWQVRSWDMGKDARLASPLRFKVIAEDNKLRAMIIHFPCSLPESLSQADIGWINNHEKAVWREVHKALDKYTGLRRAIGVWGRQQ